VFRLKPDQPDRWLRPVRSDNTCVQQFCRFVTGSSSTPVTLPRGCDVIDDVTDDVTPRVLMCRGASCGRDTRRTRSGRRCWVRRASWVATTPCWLNSTARTCQTALPSSSTTHSAYTKRFATHSFTALALFILRYEGTPARRQSRTAQAPTIPLVCMCLCRVKMQPKN